MAHKVAIPKGTRDFGQKEMARRNWIFDTIRSVFQTFGYAQIETPAMENLSTLLGKYGEEGDKLLFRILNSGDAFAGVDLGEYVSEDGCLSSPALSSKICEKGLRYDLTVPFARYVVQHQSELAFPFKRFQIQPVWRADRPQKGRYREFYQCDADVIGSKSLLNELELVQIVDKVFTQLGLRVSLHINNRKVLSGLAQIAGVPDKVTDITVAIDKLEKIGFDAVKEELLGRGLSEKSIAVIESVLLLSGSNCEKISAIRALLSGGSSSGLVSEAGLAGVAELEELFSLIGSAEISQEVKLDLSLARGLNYYTGAIFEVKALDCRMGSICGGGRYDNLTGIFGLPNMSGVGISFGADRIYDVLNTLGAFPTSLSSTTKLLFANMDPSALGHVLSIADTLRNRGVACEVYPDAVKLKKQFDYASKRAIPFISINGSDELCAGVVNVKNLSTGEQRCFPKGATDEIVGFVGD